MFQEETDLVSYPQAFHRWAMMSCSLSGKQDKEAGEEWVGGTGAHTEKQPAVNNPEDSLPRKAVAPPEPFSCEG